MPQLLRSATRRRAPRRGPLRTPIRCSPPAPPCRPADPGRLWRVASSKQCLGRAAAGRPQCYMRSGAGGGSACGAGVRLRRAQSRPALWTALGLLRSDLDCHRESGSLAWECRHDWNDQTACFDVGL